MRIEFMFYWRGNGEFVPFPSFYVTETDGSLPLHGNVSKEQIEKAGHQVPDHPTYKEWNENVFAIRNCGYCYEKVDGLVTLENHIQTKHPFALRRKAQ